MAKLRQLTVTFDTEIQPWELSAFRGAIAEKAGYEHEHFHNHNSEGGFHYRYPLIQYKYDHHRPMLVCLNDGVEEMYHFFSQPDWTLHLDNGSVKTMKIAQLDVRQHTVQPWEDTVFRYHLRQWFALNEDNYESFRRMNGLLERIELLETILTNHLVALCQSIGQAADQRLIRAKILTLKDTKWIAYKRTKMLAFSLEFESNLNIPDYIGIGKGASMGFGVVKALRKG